MSNNLSFDESTNVLTVADVEGVDYTISGKVVTGEVKLTKDTTVVARPQPGRTFPRGAQTRFEFKINKDVVDQETAEAVQSRESNDSDSVDEPTEPVESRAYSSRTGLSRAAGTTPAPPPTGGTP